jgi:hypothetical protein
VSCHADTIRDLIERHDGGGAGVLRPHELEAIRWQEAENQQLREALAAAEHDAAMWRGALNATAEAARMGESDDELEMRAVVEE